MTGLPFQVITRTGTGNYYLKVADPNGFRGVWASGNNYLSQYYVIPDEGKTAEFQRFAHGCLSPLRVASGGKARIRDLLGRGSLVTFDTGELIINTPRTLGTRTVSCVGGTMTLESPSEPESPAPAAGASWRFDAAAIDTLRTCYNEEDGRTYVTNWCDANGGEAMAYASLEACRPFISPITVNGHHLVDFGAYKKNTGAYYTSGADLLYGSAAFMLIGKTNSLSVVRSLGQDVCEMFVVVKGHEETAYEWVAPLGYDADDSNNRLAMMFYSGGMFHSSYSRVIYGRGEGNEGDYRAWLNGEPYIGTTLNATDALGDISRWNPTGLNIIALNFKGKTRPTLSTLGTARFTSGKECGGFAMAEAIIYKTELTDAERRQTIEYLKRKWLSGVEAKPFDMDAAIIGNASAQIKVESGNTAKVRTLRRAANISSGNIVKIGDGTLEVEEIMPQSATLEVRGGGVMLSHDTPAASTDRANVPTDGMLCWLDATSSGAFETDGSGGITKWKDCRGGYSTSVFAANANGSATSLPTEATDSTSGLTVVDFGSTVATTQPYFKITVNSADMAKVQESFIVWKRNGDGIPGLLSGLSNDGAARRSNNRLSSQLDNKGYVVAMLWNVDGRPIIAECIDDFKDVNEGTLAVVNGTSARQKPWCYLALSSYGGNKGGGCAIGEVIAYNRQLTDAERRNVTAYLMNKWENGVTHSLDTDDTVAKIAFTSGAAPKVGTRTDRTVTSITGSGTFTKTGAGKLTVTSLDAGVTALDIKEGDIGLTSLSGITTVSYALDAAGISGSVVLDGAVTLPAAMTVNVTVDSEFGEGGEYPLVKVGSFASTPDISAWALNMTGNDKLMFSLVCRADGVYLQSRKRGIMLIVY